MTRRRLPCAVATTAAILLPLWVLSASAQDRMPLGVPDLSARDTVAGEFRASAGDRVFFADGSAELSTRARRAIEMQAQWLGRNPALAITIEGHADDQGTGEDNLKLSQSRADAVRSHLIRLGIAEERITIAAFGKSRTVADCAGSACAAQNRRAVTVVGPAAHFPAGEAAGPRPLETSVEPTRRMPRHLF
jgi:peptidoglycan-associated lipoprotein